MKMEIESDTIECKSKRGKGIFLIQTMGYL